MDFERHATFFFALSEVVSNNRRGRKRNEENE
jgi:hypothetical protein